MNEEEKILTEEQLAFIGKIIFEESQSEDWKEYYQQYLEGNTNMGYFEWKLTSEVLGQYE